MLKQLPGIECSVSRGMFAFGGNCWKSGLLGAEYLARVCNARGSCARLELLHTAARSTAISSLEKNPVKLSQKRPQNAYCVAGGIRFIGHESTSCETTHE